MIQIGMWAYKWRVLPFLGILLVALLMVPLVIRAPAKQALTAVSSHASSFRTRLQAKQKQLVPSNVGELSAEVVTC